MEGRNSALILTDLRETEAPGRYLCTPEYRKSLSITDSGRYRALFEVTVSDDLGALLKELEKGFAMLNLAGDMTQLGKDDGPLHFNDPGKWFPPAIIDELVKLSGVLELLKDR